MTSFREMSEGDQAALYHARGRLRSFRDLTKGLFRTRMIAADETSPANNFAEEDFESPVTFHTRIRTTGTTISGVIMHCGSDSRGISMWVDAGVLRAHCGNLADPIPDDGVIAEIDFPNVSGNEFDVAVAVSPRTGVIMLWGNDKFVRAQSVDNELRAGAWSILAEEFKFGAEISAPPAIISGAGVGDPTGFQVIAPLSVFVRQMPRQMTPKRV